jgi:hypothetical protein
MGPPNPKAKVATRSSALYLLCILLGVYPSAAQQAAMPASASPAPSQQRTPAPQPTPAPQAISLPDAPGVAAGSIAGSITDTDGASIPNAAVVLVLSASKQPLLSTRSGPDGDFVFSSIAPGTYRLRIKAAGFAVWTVENIFVRPAETVTLAPVQLGVESLASAVDAITVEDLAEQQITTEEHQRILGVLPNFFVSYVSNPQPLTRKQKFKLALVVSRDPLTFFTTGVTAGIEQAENDFSGYGPGWAGYGQRYAATYGDRIDSTFLGAALLPSLLHQDPRYFYLGHGTLIHRALYAISTVVICKGDNGRWQPNYSNVFGNLGAAGVSSLYYPRSDRHSLQVTVDDTLLGIAEGSFGTLFQEFLLRHLTHGAPPKPPPLPPPQP